MPHFVLNRTWALQGHGHSINFVKGEPTWVPPPLVNDAVAIGAECVDEVVDVLGPEKAEEVELSAEEREVLLNAAFDQIVARNGQDGTREDFNAQGLPNIKALTVITGFEPKVKERNAAWQKYREAKGI